MRRIYDRLVRVLLAWSLPSLAAGGILMLLGSDFWFGFGLQSALWGLIDTALVAVGRRSAVRRARKEGEARALSKLARTLRNNGFVDIGYIAVGIALCLIWGLESSVVLGHGAGIIVQGGFLLVFDFRFAEIVSQEG